MKSSRLWARLLLAGASSLLVLLFLRWAEFALERHYYSQTYRYYATGEVYVEDENTLLLFSPDRDLFWVIKAGIELHIEEDPEQYALHLIGSFPGHYEFTVKSNSVGLNSPEVELEKPADTMRIVTLGDSRTMAEGVGFERLYSRRLESLFRTSDFGRRVEVINGGVSGYSSYQGRVQLEKKLLAYQPEIVTVLFGINDQDRDQGVGDLRKAEIYDSWLVSLRGLINRSMLIYSIRRHFARLKAGIFGKTPLEPAVYRDGEKSVRRVSLPEYRTNLNSFVDLGRTHGFEPVFLIVPASPYAFFPSLSARSTPLKMRRAAMKTFRRGRSAFDRGSWELAAASLQELIEEIPDFNSARHMLAVSLQNLGRFPEAKEHFLQLNQRAIFSRYEEVVREVAANRNALLLDLTPHFTAVTDSSLYLDDMHPSEVGHELIARRLFETLSAQAPAAPARGLQRARPGL